MEIAHREMLGEEWAECMIFAGAAGEHVNSLGLADRLIELAGCIYQSPSPIGIHR
jgi:hypothetical protein